LALAGLRMTINAAALVIAFRLRAASWEDQITD
jgi:hypothetical protein